MALETKYAELINAAKSGGVENLQVREQNNVCISMAKLPAVQ